MAEVTESPSPRFLKILRSVSIFGDVSNDSIRETDDSEMPHLSASSRRDMPSSSRFLIIAERTCAQSSASSMYLAAAWSSAFTLFFPVHVYFLFTMP
ncbi:MAG: hypothetical protein SPL69_09090 [Succinivibrionaceae bacterium]|nr:hypothetical protein [Succinivibrionaceae bacterium]MDY6376248.1 hypothetical protein [Succinivibrionaceae bacterium]